MEDAILATLGLLVLGVIAYFVYRFYKWLQSMEGSSPGQVINPKTCGDMFCACPNLAQHGNCLSNCVGCVMKSGPYSPEGAEYYCKTYPCHAGVGAGRHCPPGGKCTFETPECC